MTGYDSYCDHLWMREDELTKQCVKCKQYKGIKESDDGL